MWQIIFSEFSRLTSMSKYARSTKVAEQCSLVGTNVCHLIKCILAYFKSLLVFRKGRPKAFHVHHIECDPLIFSMRLHRAVHGLSVDVTANSGMLGYRSVHVSSVAFFRLAIEVNSYCSFCVWFALICNGFDLPCQLSGWVDVRVRSGRLTYWCLCSMMMLSVSQCYLR